MQDCKGIHMQGSVTVEAALVFPIVLFVLLAVIRFGFYIHDLTAVNMVNEYAAVRERNMLWSSYDPVEQRINIKEIVNKGIIELESPYHISKKQYIYRQIKDYKSSIQMGGYEEGDKGYEGAYIGLKNSTVVRAVHILMNHAERIKHD